MDINEFKVLVHGDAKTASAVSDPASHFGAMYVVEMAKDETLLKAAESLVEGCRVSGDSPSMVFYRSITPKLIKKAYLPRTYMLLALASPELNAVAKTAAAGDWTKAAGGMETAANAAWEGSKLVPGVGIVTSGLSALIDAARGNWGSAAFNALGAIPIAGRFMQGARLGKMGLKAVRAAKGTSAVAKTTKAPFKSLTRWGKTKRVLPFGGAAAIAGSTAMGGAEGYANQGRGPHQQQQPARPYPQQPQQRQYNPYPQSPRQYPQPNPYQ